MQLICEISGGLTVYWTFFGQNKAKMMNDLHTCLEFGMPPNIPNVSHNKYVFVLCFKS